MTHEHTTHKSKKSNPIERFAHWLFGSPFQSLPSAFGDQVPPELRVLEAEVEEAQHQVEEVPASPTIHERQSRPARRK
jgi:hypothetical protein